MGSEGLGEWVLVVRFLAWGHGEYPLSPRRFVSMVGVSVGVFVGVSASVVTVLCLLHVVVPLGVWLDVVHVVRQLLELLMRQKVQLVLWGRHWARNGCTSQRVGRMSHGPEITWATEGVWFLGGMTMLLSSRQGQGGSFIVFAFRLRVWLRL